MRLLLLVLSSYRCALTPFGDCALAGKLVVLAAKACAVPMSTASSFWGWALWIPAIICFVNLAQNAYYVYWMTTLPAWAQIPTGRSVAMRRLARQAAADGGATTSTAPWRFTFLPDVRVIRRIPRFFWIIILSQILQAGVVGGELFCRSLFDAVTDTHERFF